ncbi:hypothetical protein NQ176_g5464 [Zarea fungicola]|uniref:Uncharacterized protein n=1 Tax=Zarea fungicola TaxID=93591 RepID=A0ACC1NAR0_9HYPO|nr:hypothetical protein NQ176_g5464 [Lecanicillium fungicola]
MANHLVSVDARNKLEDLSGIVINPGDNPYKVFIEACNDNHAEIQTLYETHRVKRNAQQKEKFLSAEFKELVIDQYLLRITNPTIQPGFQDERNCLVIWARPPAHIIQLAVQVQQMLKKAAPGKPTNPLHSRRFLFFFLFKKSHIFFLTPLFFSS